MGRHKRESKMLSSVTGCVERQREGIKGQRKSVKGHKERQREVKRQWGGVNERRGSAKARQRGINSRQKGVIMVMLLPKMRWKGNKRGRVSVKG